MQISSGGEKANESTCEREVAAARMRQRPCIHARINVIKQTRWGESARKKMARVLLFVFLERKQKGERSSNAQEEVVAKLKL